MNDTWAVIGLLTLTTILLRASGPLLMGRRQLPEWTVPVVTVLPAALLTALIVIQVLTKDGQVTLDERLAGLAAAAGVLWWRRNALIPAMLAAAAVVAVLRLIS